MKKIQHSAADHSPCTTDRDRDPSQSPSLAPTLEFQDFNRHVLITLKAGLLPSLLHQGSPETSPSTVTNQTQSRSVPTASKCIPATKTPVPASSSSIKCAFTATRACPELSRLTTAAIHLRAAASLEQFASTQTAVSSEQLARRHTYSGTRPFERNSTYSRPRIGHSLTQPLP